MFTENTSTLFISVVIGSLLQRPLFAPFVSWLFISINYLINGHIETITNTFILQLLYSGYGGILGYYITRIFLKKRMVSINSMTGIGMLNIIACIVFIICCVFFEAFDYWLGWELTVLLVIGMYILYGMILKVKAEHLRQLMKTAGRIDTRKKKKHNYTNSNRISQEGCMDDEDDYQKKAEFNVIHAYSINPNPIQNQYGDCQTELPCDVNNMKRKAYIKTDAVYECSNDKTSIFASGDMFITSTQIFLFVALSLFVTLSIFLSDLLLLTSLWENSPYRMFLIHLIPLLISSIVILALNLNSMQYNYHRTMSMSKQRSSDSY